MGMLARSLERNDFPSVQCAHVHVCSNVVGAVSIHLHAPSTIRQECIVANLLPPFVSSYCPSNFAESMIAAAVVAPDGHWEPGGRSALCYDMPSYGQWEFV
eukprot:m.279459 g.279459  ORF g.279459 m.279459 type:complete len:101 (-) comp141316_c0_seq1:10-312(-)